jgi:hypothetical protein
MPSRRSVPGDFPEAPSSLTMSRRSSESWKATPTSSPKAVSATTSAGSTPAKAAPKRADVATSEPVLSASTPR